MKYFIGVEGGSSNTIVLLLNEQGEIVTEVRGAGSNAFLLGIDGVFKLLQDLILKAFSQAGLPEDTNVLSLGACMSGMLGDNPEKMTSYMLSHWPTLTDKYYFDNDSPGSVYTATGNKGGCVLIEGTGQMCELISPEGKSYYCGGHGHMFGDEGSAYWLASTAIREIQHSVDCFSEDPNVPPPDVQIAKAAMFRFFNLKKMDDLLRVMYDEFNKGSVAAFAAVLSALATGSDPLCNGKPDPYCVNLFYRAGRIQGSFVRSLAPNVLKCTKADDGSSRVLKDFAIVIVGSVWKSWSLLKNGFVESITSPFHYLPARAIEGHAGEGDENVAFDYPPELRGRVASFKLLSLKVSSAVGSAWKAAYNHGIDLPIQFESMTDVVYSH